MVQGARIRAAMQEKMWVRARAKHYFKEIWSLHVLSLIDIYNADKVYRRRHMAVSLTHCSLVVFGAL